MRNLALMLLAVMAATVVLPFMVGPWLDEPTKKLRE